MLTQQQMIYARYMAQRQQTLAAYARRMAEERRMQELKAEQTRTEQPVADEIPEIPPETPIQNDVNVPETPVTEEPVVEEPMVEEPVTEEPAVEEPVAEEPTVEEPVAEESIPDNPVSDTEFPVDETADL